MQVKHFAVKLTDAIGIVCCLILVISSLIGLIRGYSIQNTYLLWLLPIVILCVPFRVRKGRSAFITWFFWLVVYAQLFTGIVQGRHYRAGLTFYNQGAYRGAIEEFEKETQLWYLKLGVNVSQPHAMLMLAKSYYQVGDFDKARDTYKLVVIRYSGTAYEPAASAHLEP
ncbi:MAG: tetratricopeptide repeat protein [Planctomycetaceae bacterium]|nr:tetratricopeptide repeat protein [Planctomycetaceae bacterium]